MWNPTKEVLIALLMDKTSSGMERSSTEVELPPDLFLAAIWDQSGFGRTRSATEVLLTILYKGN